MKTVGIITSEAATSEVKSISDEKIDKLLLSSDSTDRDIGRVLLLGKYPSLKDKIYTLRLAHCPGADKKYYALDWKDIVKVSDIRRGVSNTLLIKKELVDG